MFSLCSRWLIVFTCQRLVGNVNSIAPFANIISNIARLSWLIEGTNSRMNPFEERGYNVSMTIDDSTFQIRATGSIEESME